MVSRQLIDYLNLERTRNQSARHQGSGWRADGGDYSLGRSAVWRSSSSSSTWRLGGSSPCSRIDNRTAASSRSSESMVSKSRRPPSHRERLKSHDLGRRFVLVCCTRTVRTCPLTDGNANLRFICVCQRKYFAKHYPDYEVFELCPCLSFGKELAEPLALGDVPGVKRGRGWEGNEDGVPQACRTGRRLGGRHADGGVYRRRSRWW